MQRAISVDELPPEDDKDSLSEFAELPPSWSGDDVMTWTFLTAWTGVARNAVDARQDKIA